MDSNDLTTLIKEELLSKGACLVGVGDLTELPAEERKGLPLGMSVMVKYPAGVIQGIAELPTQEYCSWYNQLNDLLDELVTSGAELLRSHGYTASAQTRAEVGFGENEDSTTLPHKTVATRAGLGWIGKSALLITEQYGSMVRLSSILTDAPLIADKPINTSKCRGCTLCADTCPAEAIKGNEWEKGTDRSMLVDVITCRKTARARSKQGFGSDEHTICGKCIEVCPYTRRAWKSE